MKPNEKFEDLYNGLTEANQELLLNYILNKYYKISMEGFNAGPNAKIILQEGFNAGPNAKIISQQEICSGCGRPK